MKWVYNYINIFHTLSHSQLESGVGLEGFVSNMGVDVILVLFELRDEGDSVVA